MNGGDITAVCAGTTSGTTFTMSADCDTTAPLTVPDGVTVDGAGHTITAHDTTPASGSLNGAVLTNAGASMTIEALHIVGTFEAVPGCGRTNLWGIYFNNASGTVSNVTVEGITESSGCNVGRAIYAAATAPQTLTVTGTTVSGYQKNGVQTTGPVTLNMSGSTIGPPANLHGIIAQNGLFTNGVSGTVSGNVVYGSGSGLSSGVGTAAVIAGTNFTFTDNTVTSDPSMPGTDYGVVVQGSSTGNSTGITISFNQIGRTMPDIPDSFGWPVVVYAPSTATVICNTLSGWNHDVFGVAPQPVCITTPELPSGTVTVPYSDTLAAVGGTAPYTWSLASGSLPPGLVLSPSGTITGTPTASGTFTFTIKATDASAGTDSKSFTIVVAGVGTDVDPSHLQGYWLGADEGGVFAFGAATFHGSAANSKLNAAMVGIANTPAAGYWLVGSDGGVFSFGASFFGSLGSRPLLAPIVGVAATPEGDGYYLVGADGSVFTFGAAVFRGSMEGRALNKPVVGIGVTPDNGGYYLVASDGGVFTFGDARFQGSMGGKSLTRPVVGMAVDNVTSGYWLVAGDGGVFAFAAPYLGSMGGKALNAPVVGMAATADDNGYRFAAADGGVFCFGIAEFHGSMGGIPLKGPVVGMSSIGP